jgi:hypothetical protein
MDGGADPSRTISSTQYTPAMLAARRKEKRGVDVRWAFDGRTPPAYATEASKVNLVTDGPGPVIELTRAEMERVKTMPFALVDISLKVDPFPCDLAFEVSLRQGPATFPASPFFLPAGESIDGLAFQVFASGIEPGSIEILLRPSRDEAMRKQTHPKAIWGEDVLLRGELVEKR